MSTFPLEVRSYRPGDEFGILDALRLRFRAMRSQAEPPGPTHQAAPLDLESWRWMFERNPAGRELVVAIDAKGQVAGHRAAVPQIVDTDRGSVRFVYWHTAVTRSEQNHDPDLDVAARLTSALADAQRLHGVELGYRVDPAQRDGTELGDALHETALMSRDVRRPSSMAPRDLEIAQEGYIPSGTNALYRRVLRRRSCMLRRDRSYMHWRYIDNPERRGYEIWSARRRGMLVGLIVVRPYFEAIEDASAICDWLVPDHDHAAAEALLATACRRARACRRPRVVSLCAPNDPDADRLLANGFEADPAQRFRLGYRLTGPFLDAAFLQRSWSYSLGDTHLVG